LNNRSGKSGGDSRLDTQTISARDATHPGAQNLNLTKRYRLWPSGSASSGRCTKLENANRWRNLSLEEASNCGPECDSAHYRSNPHYSLRRTVIATTAPIQHPPVEACLA